jgi:hypothetical protein
MHTWDWGVQVVPWDWMFVQEGYAKERVDGDAQEGTHMKETGLGVERDKGGGVKQGLVCVRECP